MVSFGGGCWCYQKEEDQQTIYSIRQVVVVSLLMDKFSFGGGLEKYNTERVARQQYEEEE